MNGFEPELSDLRVLLRHRLVGGGIEAARRRMPL